MFDYFVNDYNPSPRLVTAIRPADPGFVRRHLPYGTRVTGTLPDNLTELHRQQTSKYWASRRRQARNFCQRYGPMTFRIVDQAVDLRLALPQVQQLFTARWSGRYVSLPWTTLSGFEPYATAMIQLAQQGGGFLAVLEGNGQLLSFGYCLTANSACYVYQLAATRDERYRPYAPGLHLTDELVRYLVVNGYREIDFGVGDYEYKRRWAGERSPVYLRLEERTNISGHLSLAAAWLFYTAKLYVQFRNRRLRAVAIRVLRIRRHRHRCPFRRPSDLRRVGLM